MYKRMTQLSFSLQFVQRLALPFIPDKYKPDYPYLRLIPNIRIHLYTLFQVVFFLLLCIFKVVDQISIVFPIMVSGEGGGEGEVEREREGGRGGVVCGGRWREREGEGERERERGR